MYLPTIFRNALQCLVLAGAVLWHLESSARENHRSKRFDSDTHRKQAEYDSIMSLEQDIVITKKAAEKLLWSEWKDQESRATCHYEFGKFLYINNLKDPVRHFQKAVDIRIELGDYEGLKPSLNNIGLIHFKNRRYFESLRAYQKLTSYGISDRLHAKAFSAIGDCHEKLGDYHSALSAYHESVRLYSRLGNLTGLYKAHLQISRLYSLMGRLKHKEGILKSLNQVDSIAALLRMPLIDRYIVVDRKANLYDETGDYHLSIKYHQTALGIALEMKDSVALYSVHNNLAISLMKSQQYGEALAHLRQALAHAKQANQMGKVFNNLGDYFLNTSQYDTALICYQRSILLFAKPGTTFDAAYKNPDEEVLLISPFKPDLLKCLEDKADYWLAIYKRSNDSEHQLKALEDIKLADKILEMLRYKSAEEESKLFWRNKASSIYTKAVGICRNLGDTNGAFYFMEKNKAIMLLEHINHTLAMSNSGLPQAIQEELSVLREEVKRTELAHFLEGSGSASTLLDIRNRYMDYELKLNEQYPKYSLYKQKLELVSIEQLRGYMPIEKNTMLLQYILSNKVGYCLYIGAESVGISIIGDIPALVGHVNELTALCSRPMATERDVSRYAALSHQVFQQIIPEEIILSKEVKKLIIAPDFVLQGLAFEALVSSSHGERLPESFLVNQAEISYVYSFSHLLANEKSARQNVSGMAVFTPISFPGSQLPPLPGTQNETGDVAAQNFSYDQASKRSFVKNLPKYEMIHLATHASFDDDHWPWIRFSDSVMYLPEIYALDNNAELVVLNACGTSQGEVKSGEGVMSLARGFFHSGAKSVIATLWNINDNVSALIFTRFYQHLTDGQSKSMALCQAKRDYLKTAKGSAISPYYWSPFVLIGDPDPVAAYSESNYILLFIIVMFAIVVTALLVIRKFPL